MQAASSLGQEGKKLLSAHWKLSIVYDSEALQGFEKGWGFSALISSDEHCILFDCGWDGHLLRRNLGRIGHTFADLDFVVLSHGHWDHISGLTEILHDAILPETLEVVLPAAFSNRLRKEISKRVKIREITAPEEIVRGIYTVGSLGSDIKEQSLLIRFEDSGVLITGCAHPGVGTIIRAASEIATPKWLVGGFHNSRLEEFPQDLERIIICHCTTQKSELLKAFGERASIGASGSVFALNLQS